MVDGSTPLRAREFRTVRSAPRLEGWVGAWTALVVLAGWHGGFGFRLLSASWPAQPIRVPLPEGGEPFLCWLPAGPAALAAILALRARRADQGAKGFHAVPFLFWFALAFTAGMRGAPVPRACGSGRATPPPDRTEWIVRVESIDWAQARPLWSGRAFAWVDRGAWRRLPRPLRVQGNWSEAETGGFLLRGRAIPPASGDRYRLQVASTYRLTGRAGAGRNGPGARFAPWRASLAARVRRACGPDAGELAVRTLLGPALPASEAWCRPFRETGTMHLLSISGFHLTLIGGLLWTALRVVTGGAPWSRWPALIALGTYAWFVGGPIPVRRALGVAWLLACGPGWGRARRFWNALGWLAAMLPIVEPTAPGSASFRLSFAAMAGVVWGASFASAHLPRRSPRAGPGDRRGPALVSVARPALQLLCASLGASALTAPWSFHHFGVVYPLGVAANLLAIPAMGVTLAVQGVCVLAIACGAGESFPLVAMGRLSGESFLAGLRGLAAVSGRWGWVGGCGLLAALAWTLALSVALSVVSRRGGPLRAALRWLGLGALPALVAVATERGREPESAVPLEVAFLDVGQGDAVLLRLGSRRWLVDLGLGSLTGRRDRLVPALCRGGVRRLDRVWLTHGDGDHWGGLGDLLASPVRVDTLVLPWGAPFPATFWETLARAPQRPVLQRLGSGWERSLDAGVRARVLHPPPLAGSALLPPPRNSNDGSLALLLETRAATGAWCARALLSGDLGREREAELLRAWGPGPPVSVALLAHHGSRTAGGEAWWGRARPGLAVVSAGRGNVYGLPHAETLAAARRHGARLRRTDEHGAIRCGFGARGARVRTERPPCPSPAAVL